MLWEPQLLGQISVLHRTALEFFREVAEGWGVRETSGEGRLGRHRGYQQTLGKKRSFSLKSRAFSLSRMAQNSGLGRDSGGQALSLTSTICVPLERHLPF